MVASSSAMTGPDRKRGGRARFWRPAADWPELRASDFRPDLVAGAIGALIAIPQAIALAALAGLPPEYGVYTSIVPVIVAVLWGSSWHLVSGPNTAVSLMLAASIAPLTSEPGRYFQLILLMTLMVALAQIAIGALRVGSVLDFVSGTVITAVIHAVAIIMMVSSLASMAGIETPAQAGFPAKLAQLLTGFDGASAATLFVGGVTVLTGLLARWWWRRYALVLALLSGVAAAGSWPALGGVADDIPVLGPLSLRALPVSWPPLDAATLAVGGSLAGNALAIAFVGLMQSVLIARSLAVKSGQRIDPNRECLGQGCANLSACFVSGFAGSGSFNRSALQLQLGARTPLAVVYGAVILLALVLLARPALAWIPHASVAGVLVLVGLGLLDPPAVRRIFLSREETLIFVAVLLASLLSGLTAGVLVGVLLSLVIYLARTSVPRLDRSILRARDGGEVIRVGFDGNLFFGSVPAVEQRLPRPPASGSDAGRLLLDTSHVSYLDIAGAELLLRQVDRWRRAGRQAWIHVPREALTACFENTGLLPEVGLDCLIRADRPHVMKDLLPGVGRADSPDPRPPVKTPKEEYTVEALARRLHAMPFLGPIPFNRLYALLQEQPVEFAEPGDIIVRAEDSLEDHLILLDGEMEAQRVWTTGGGYDKSYTWTVTPDGAEGGTALISAAARRLRVRAVSAVQFLRLNADSVDELLGWNWAQDGAVSENGGSSAGQRMELVRHVGIFHHIPLERVREAFARMQSENVAAGDVIVREGEKGDRYYVIEEGEAEVIRTDPFSGETRVVDHMGAGDGFGEESLLQDGFRNATIRMLTPGRLLNLDRREFERLIQPSMVEEIDPAEAHQLLEAGEVRLLDCRYDLEYEESRIPDAHLIPLHLLRFQAHEIDPDAHYIVYCRSGRRSKAAAFLLRERNISAVSLRGGIKGWPYEVDAEPIDH